PARRRLARVEDLRLAACLANGADDACGLGRDAAQMPEEIEERALEREHSPRVAVDHAKRCAAHGATAVRRALAHRKRRSTGARGAELDELFDDRVEKTHARDDERFTRNHAAAGFGAAR